jgi:O-antigen/teichoic acid export membrane protein
VKSIIQVFSFDILAKAFLGVMGILLIRFMGSSEYAHYTLAVSIVTIVTQAFATSFNRLYIVGRSRLAQCDPSGFLGLQLAALLGLAAAALAFYGQIGPIFWLILLAASAATLTEFSKTFFQEQLKFLRFSFIELARTMMILAGVAGGFLLLGKGMAAWQVLTIQSFAMLMVFTVVFAGKIDFARVFRLGQAWRLVREAAKKDFAYLFAYFFLFSFFGQLDIWMLRILTDDQAVATYGSAFRYYAIVIMGLSSVHVVLLPFTQKVGSIRQLRATFKKYRRFILLSAPLILIGAWLSQWLIPLIDGGKYPQAIQVFRILAVSSIISLAFSPYVNTVMRFGKFRYLLSLVCAGIGICVTGNLILVPHFGATGTAITTLISFAFVNGMTFLKGNELLNRPDEWLIECGLSDDNVEQANIPVLVDENRQALEVGR